MNKTEILNIVNEPSKHIHIVKIDGKDSIVYSSKFVELLELISEMLTKGEVISMLTNIQSKINEAEMHRYDDQIDKAYNLGLHRGGKIIQEKINSLKEEV